MNALHHENPGGGGGPRGWRDVLRWRLTERDGPWPRHVSAPQLDALVPPAANEALCATWIGHATFVLESHDAVIVTDPIWSARASPLPFAGPRRVVAPALPLVGLARVDAVVVSHDHFDHMDRASLRALARRFDPLFVVPAGNGSRLARFGCRRVAELEWWGSIDAGRGTRLTLAPARHWSGRMPWFRGRALWGSFAIDCGGRRAYFAGDSGFGPHFAEIGARLGPFDLALLPIGSYAPRWFMREVHVDPAEAVAAHRALGARRSVAMHFGTFRISGDGYDEPPRELARARAAAGLDEAEFVALPIGGRCAA